jgi:hypothetical protein
MFYKTSKNDFNSGTLKAIYERHKSNLDGLSEKEVGSYAYAHLKGYYASLMNRAAEADDYPEFFPAISINGFTQKKNGDLHINFNNSPRLSAAFSKMVPTIQAMVNAKGEGLTSCLGVTTEPLGANQESFARTPYLMRRMSSPSGKPTIDEIYDLHDKQMKFFKTHGHPGNISGCDDELCRDCHICSATLSEMGNSVYQIVTDQNPADETTWDFPKLVGYNMNVLGDSLSVIGRHQMELGNTVDTMRDSRFARHRGNHDGISSMSSAMAALLHHPGIHDFDESGGRGGFVRTDQLWVPTQPRLSVPTDLFKDIDEVPPVPAGNGKPQRPSFFNSGRQQQS